MVSDEVGGNPSRCDSCRYYPCEEACEGCEEKAECGHCPLDCGAFDITAREPDDDWTDPDEEEGRMERDGEEDLEPEDDEYDDADNQD